MRSSKANLFYLHHGFVASPIDELTVMLNVAKLPAEMQSLIVKLCVSPFVPMYSC